MLTSFLILLFSIGLLAFFVLPKKKKTWNWNDFPKGPRGLPIVGNLLQLGSKPHLQLSKWATQYGPYFTCNLAGKPMLVVNTAKAIKSVFGHMPSTGKYEFELFSIVYSENMGLLSSTGTQWLEHVKFTRKTLKDFGLSGGVQLDNLILDECTELCVWIDENLKNGCNEIYLDNAFLKVSSNAVWNMISGEKVRSRDSKLVPLMEELIHTFNKASILTFMPWLKHIAPKMSGYTDYVEAVNNIHKFLRNAISKRRELRKSSPGEYVSKDLIDAYLDKVESSENTEDSIFHGERGLEESFYSILGFIFAGSETTSVSMNWLVFYLVAYPEVQYKLREEVDRVIGKQGNPTLSEKHRMPYLESVVYEILRITSNVPLGVMHKLLEPITYDGYNLPKDMILLANCYHANHDPNVWGDAENFRPERFLERQEDEDQRKQLRECIMSFQEGKRHCPGSQVAKDEIFMVAAKLVQRYEFYPEKGRNKMDYTRPVVGYLLVPRQLNVLVKPRTQE